MGILALTCMVPICGLLFWMAFSSGTSSDDRLFPACMALVLLGAACGSGYWIWRRRRVPRLSRDAIARNQKRVVRGMLSKVEIVADGRLRYVIDDAAVEVDLLLGLGATMSYLLQRPIRNFQYLDDMVVELHCVALGPDITLLLQAQYPFAKPATRTERPVQPDDRDRAGKEVKMVAIVAPCLCFIVPLLAWMIGRVEPALAVALGVFTAFIVAVTLPFIVLPRLLRARRSAGVVTVEGPVTEIVSSRVLIGRTTSATVLWYRVGGVMFCPFGAGVDGGPAELGQVARFEFMARKGRRGDGMLMNFQTGEKLGATGGCITPIPAAPTMPVHPG